MTLSAPDVRSARSTPFVQFKRLLLLQVSSRRQRRCLHLQGRGFIYWGSPSPVSASPHLHARSRNVSTAGHERVVGVAFSRRALGELGSRTATQAEGPCSISPPSMHLLTGTNFLFHQHLLATCNEWWPVVSAFLALRLPSLIPLLILILTWRRPSTVKYSCCSQRLRPRPRHLLFADLHPSRIPSVGRRGWRE
jgi:hypothetical protein